MSMKLKLSAVAVALAMSNLAQAAESLDEVVVTAPQSTEPLTVKTDPKKPRQPVPAHDGADYLKTIPGFSVIRKGGTDGDPVFRGMAGSRLNILLDGEQILGGCGMRMDPPTAYVFPASYDRITLLKGPQTVLYGPGNSAGAVLFERVVDRAGQVGTKAQGALMLGRGWESPLQLDPATTPIAALPGPESPVDTRYAYWTGSSRSWQPIGARFARMPLKLGSGWACALFSPPTKRKRRSIR